MYGHAHHSFPWWTTEIGNQLLATFSGGNRVLRIFIHIHVSCHQSKKEAGSLVRTYVCLSGENPGKMNMNE